MHRTTHARAHGRSGVLAVVAALVAACGGGAPTVAPTTAPTPTSAAPTATPFDVGAAFLAIVSDPDFTAKFELEGSIEMGVTVAISGTIEGDGADSRQTSTITFGSVTTSTESVKVGQQSWSRTLPGPWLAKPTSSSSGNTLAKWLGGLASLTDLGIVTKDGTALHHLRPVAGSKVPPDALGLDPQQFSNPDITMEMYARDDGTPALFEMSGSWVQVVNGQQLTVELAVDMKVSNVGDPVTITAPTDVWTAYASDLGYTAAHPAGFTVERGDQGDTYRKDGTDWFYVFTYADGKGMTAAGFRDAILAGYAKDPGPPRETPVAMTVGGEPAYKAAFAFKANDGGDIVLVDVLTVHADLGWEISLVTTPSLEAAESKVFETFLASFKFSD